MKSLGIMRGESHFRSIFGPLLCSLCVGVVGFYMVGVTGGGVLAVNSFRKSIQFRGFCIGQQTMVWREPKI